MWSERSKLSVKRTAQLRSSAHRRVTSAVMASICDGEKKRYLRKCCAFSSIAQQPYRVQIFSSVATTPLSAGSLLASSMSASRNMLRASEKREREDARRSAPGVDAARAREGEGGRTGKGSPMRAPWRRRTAPASTARAPPRGSWPRRRS